MTSTMTAGKRKKLTTRMPTTAPPPRIHCSTSLQNPGSCSPIQAESASPAHDRPNQASIQSRTKTASDEATEIARMRRKAGCDAWEKDLASAENMAAPV